MTEEKEIKVDEGADLSIERFLKLTLVYTDKNRATWR
jgi:hypothetical protein